MDDSKIISGTIADESVLNADISGEEKLIGDVGVELELTGDLSMEESLSIELSAAIQNNPGIEPEELLSIIKQFFKDNPIEHPEPPSLVGYATEEWVEGRGYLTEHQDLSGYAKKSDIPAVPGWAMHNAKPTYTASEVGADPAGAAARALEDANDHADQGVVQHNVALDSHNDIRIFLQELSNRVSALADSDDTTLDQMSEVASYIKDNRELIEQITTGKVSVTDIIDNLTTNLGNRPLSAAQGVVLKARSDALELLIKAIKVPGKLSELTDDKGYATEKWVENQGYLKEHQSLADYAKKTDIPTVPTNVSAFRNDAGYLTEHQDINGFLNSYAKLGTYSRKDSTTTTAENYTLTLTETITNFAMVYIMVRSGNYVMGSALCPTAFFKTKIQLELNCMNDQSNGYYGNTQYVSDTSVKGKISGKASGFEIYGVGRIS